MAATYPLTIEGWNGLLERINALARNPPGGCDALDELPLVTAPHKWSETDIAAARAKLNAICSTNVFYAPSTGKWLKAIIDELDAAIDNGWCGCEPQEPCCVPWPAVTAVEQYLYGNYGYQQAVNEINSGGEDGEAVMAHLAECVGGPSGQRPERQIIHYTLRHLHWTNCIYQDRWLDNGLIRQYGGLDEYWYTCSNTDATIVDQGWVSSFTPSYAGSTTSGMHNYYDQPMGMGYHYDYQAGRWYETLWIGAFDVDASTYDLYVSNVCKNL